MKRAAYVAPVVFVGIDPGIASVGFAAVDANAELLAVDVLKTTADKSRTGDTQMRLGTVLSWTCRHANAYWDPFANVCAIEWPMIGAHAYADQGKAGTAQVFAAAGALVGMMRSQFRSLYAPVPGTWRAAIAGGRTPTAALHADLDRRYGVTTRLGKGKAPHGLDAIGLALYARQMHAAAPWGRPPATKPTRTRRVKA